MSLNMKFFIFDFCIVCGTNPQKGKHSERSTTLKNMNTICKAALLAAVGLTSITTVKASSAYDVILGITQQGANAGGNDFMLDLGPAITSYTTGFVNGQTWDLNSYAGFTAQGFDLSSVYWGVIGDASTPDDGANPENTWTTTAGNTPGNINGSSAFGSIETSINSIVASEFGGSGNLTYGANATMSAAGDQNSWNEQTQNPTLVNQFGNAYLNPNVTGETSDTLWQVNDDNSTPTVLGTFTLSSAGILTFNATPEPSTFGLVAVAGGLAALAWFNRQRRQQA